VKLWSRCIIIEDDELALKLIQSNLQLLGVTSEVYAFTSVVDAISRVSFEAKDLLFLDVGLPRINGIDFAKSLSIKPKIVVITSERDHAFDAYQLDVIDYILKPIDQAKLLRSLNKVNEVIRNSQNSLSSEDGKFFIRHNGKYVSVESSDILWIAAQGDYATIHTTSKRYTVKKTLTSLEEQLPATNFKRVHRSYMVNMAKVDKIDEGNLIMGEKLIPVSRARKTEVLSFFKLLD